jgi:hypothetical protein
MATVPVFRYFYGKSFEYIPVGVSKEKLLVCVVDDTCTHDFKYVLPGIHAYNTPIRYMSLVQATRLLQSRLALTYFAPHTCKDMGYDIEEINSLVSLEMIRLFKTSNAARKIQRAWRCYKLGNKNDYRD